MDLGSRAYWLLDPQLGVAGRLARHVSEDLLYSLWEVKRAGISLSDGTDPDERIEEMLSWGERHGFERIAGSDYRPPALVERRPSVSQLITQMMPSGLVAYQVYAARSHGTAGGYVNSLVPGTNPITGTDVAQVQVTLADVTEVTAVTLLSFGMVFGRVVDIFGWDADVWNRWHGHVTPQLHELWTATAPPPRGD
jgi:hypothetical protein